MTSSQAYTAAIKSVGRVGKVGGECGADAEYFFFFFFSLLLKFLPVPGDLIEGGTLGEADFVAKLILLSLEAGGYIQQDKMDINTLTASGS